MAHDVFISYATEDKPTADAVCATLESRGVRCWIAPRDIFPGREWGDAVLAGLEQSRLMVLIFSANSNRSKHVKNELLQAVENEILIIPFRIQDTFPTGTLKLHLTGLHWLDALTPPFQTHLERLCEIVEKLVPNRAEEALAPGAADSARTPQPSAQGLIGDGQPEVNEHKVAPAASQTLEKCASNAEEFDHSPDQSSASANSSGIGKESKPQNLACREDEEASGPYISRLFQICGSQNPLDVAVCKKCHHSMDDPVSSVETVESTQSDGPTGSGSYEETGGRSGEAGDIQEQEPTLNRVAEAKDSPRYRLLLVLSCGLLVSFGILAFWQWDVPRRGSNEPTRTTQPAIPLGKPPAESEQDPGRPKPPLNKKATGEESRPKVEKKPEHNTKLNPLLLAAAEKGSTRQVRELLLQGADPNAKDQDGSTPLRWISRTGDVKLVRELIDMGADVNASDGRGRTPLMGAAYRGHVDVVRILLHHGANVSARDKDGRTALIWAPQDGHVETVRLLLDCGSDIKASDNNGWTALHFALFGEEVEAGKVVAVLKLLLERGADLNAKDQGGRTALGMALQKQTDPQVVQFLLERGAVSDVERSEAVEPPDPNFPNSGVFEKPERNSTAAEDYP